jgi:DNA mismatch repair ATPase MutS
VSASSGTGIAFADEHTAERIGLPWLRAAVAPVGAFGRRHDEAIEPYRPGDEMRARDEIGHAVALAAALDPDGVVRVRAALRAVPEPAPILARARAGDALDDADFYELGRFADALTALARAWDAAGGGPHGRPPELAALRDVLAPGRDGAGFYLADAFAPELRDARAAFAAAEATLDERRDAVAARVRDALGVDAVGDEFVVLRDVNEGDVPDGVRVVRETATYRVMTIVAVSAERDAAFARLAGEEEEVRRGLAEDVARLAPSVTAATAQLGALDRMLARVAFAQRWNGCVPDLGSQRITFEEATFAPLAETLAARGRRYTPLSLDLHGVAVLTGPNMGGKSAALATAGFLCACVALGVPPPARAAALPLPASIAWIGGDSPAERARLLSSYAAEVVRARDVLAEASPRTVVLLDEFARTTGPREGRALLVAFVEALAARGALALVATHFDGVAQAARLRAFRIAGVRPERLEQVVAGDLDAALDAINAAMDYRIVDASDEAAQSDALELARLLQLQRDVVDRARAIFE